eukprot:CAMPEP_0116110828 /NCGR_PEP_ID=MMETSP0327-20121206/18132_1 /TAXON_ID=44447 /ORGANISM="Pseudo-nitzschia delicatissima, Strain B596" /LENGTH=596 /DNA_ID=CAMNT_0003604043 /DNA_START=38 /DNA_END=1828 /DNA_ORIENTATION=-
MMPSSKNILSLALFLVVASMSGVPTSAAYSDDDRFMEIDEDAQKAMEEHEASDILSPSTLEQVHVITRHGARSMLSKDSDSLAEAGGATLTPLGQKQLYDLGEWLRNEYLEVLGSSVAGQKRSLAYYNPNLHSFESSNLDRTLSSANSLAKGLFPGTMRASGAHNTQPTDPDYEEKELFESPLAVPVPVYTTGKDKNDVTLRAYTNCPTFKDRLIKLYRSKEWRQIESDFSDLLTKLARWFPEMAVDGKIPLDEVWNVYDAIHVARTECIVNENNDASCLAFIDQDTVRAAASSLATDEFENLEGLVEHVEFLKFGAGLDTSQEEGMITAGHLLGSNLLWKILNRSKGDGDFFVYSAHFGTLLGLLSTMQASKDFWRDSGGEKFFEYGSALIVEIHRSEDKGIRYFILKYKTSESEQAQNIVIHESATGVKCGQDGDSGLSMIPKASWCLLDEVIAWADIYTLRTEEAWCKACNNKEADVCLAPKRSASTLDAWAANAESMGYTTAPGATTIICLLFFGGFSAGVVMMWLVWWCSGTLVVKRRKSASGFGDGIVATKGNQIDDTFSSVSDGSKDNENVIVVEDMVGSEDLRGKEIC